MDKQFETVIYARVSSETQKADRTIDSQISAAVEHAKSMGEIVPEEAIFIDNGYSGATLQRPALDNLRNHIFLGEVSRVIVYSMDRLSRSLGHQLSLLEEFKQGEIELLLVNGTPCDDTPEGNLTHQIQGVLAEYERELLKSRTKRGRLHKARQGCVSVMSKAAYGYYYTPKNGNMDAKLEILEAEASVVRMIFELYVNKSKTISGVCKELHYQGIKTRSGKDYWCAATVRGILKNPISSGTAIYGKTRNRPRKKITKRIREKGEYPREDGAIDRLPHSEGIKIKVPAIIEESIYEQAQKKLAENREKAKRNKKQVIILSGKLVCESCGYAMHKSGGNYYRCSQKGAVLEKLQKCEMKSINRDQLDEIICGLP